MALSKTKTSKTPGFVCAGSIPSSLNHWRRSVKLMARLNKSGCLSASSFLAMQGPMKIVSTWLPNLSFNIRQCASKGEETGVKFGVSSGRYFSTYSTTAGQAVDINNFFSPLAADFCKISTVLLVTSWAPRAVSLTPRIPRRRIAAIICSAVYSGNSVIQDGAKETYISLPEEAKNLALVRSFRGCLALAGQTL